MVSVGGVEFSYITESEAAGRIMAELAAGRGGRVITPNVDFLRQMRRAPKLRDLANGATMVLADGMPIVWASRLAGTPLPERVAGSSLVPHLITAAEERGLGVLLIGGEHESTGARAVARLRDQHPGIRIDSHFPPFGFERSEEDVRAIDGAVTRLDPCICVIGLGFPKQDLLAQQLLVRHPRSWFLGAGASVAFLAGDVSRAPAWTHDRGVEWVYRLLMEPRRLVGRYARDLPVAGLILLAATSERVRGARRR